MKKLLSILASMGLLISPTISTIACTFDDKKTDIEIDKDENPIFPDEPSDEGPGEEFPSTQKEVLGTKLFNVYRIDSLETLKNIFKKQYQTIVQEKLENKYIHIFDSDSGEEIVSSIPSQTTSIEFDIIDSSDFELDNSFSLILDNISYDNKVTEEQMKDMQIKTIDLYSFDENIITNSKYLSLKENPIYFNTFKKAMQNFIYLDKDGKTKNKLFKYKSASEFAKDLDISFLDSENKVRVKLITDFYLNRTFEFTLDFNVLKSVPSNFNIDINQVINKSFVVNGQQFYNEDLVSKNFFSRYYNIKINNIQKSGNTFVDNYLKLGGKIWDLISDKDFIFNFDDKNKKMIVTSNNKYIIGSTELKVDTSVDQLKDVSVINFNEKEITWNIPTNEIKVYKYIYQLATMSSGSSFLKDVYVKINKNIADSGHHELSGLIINENMTIIEKNEDIVYSAGSNILNNDKDKNYKETFKLDSDKFDTTLEQTKKDIESKVFNIKMSHFDNRTYGLFAFDLKIKFI